MSQRAKNLILLSLALVFNIVHANASTQCPSEELCPKYESAMEKCTKSRTSKSCAEFVDIFRKLTPRFDCKRSFDTRPVPAVWLCDEGKTSFPKPYEKGVTLLSKLKFKEAVLFFGSKDLQATMDGAVAEDFMSKSRAAAKRAKP